MICDKCKIQYDGNHACIFDQKSVIGEKPELAFDVRGWDDQVLVNDGTDFRWVGYTPGQPRRAIFPQEFELANTGIDERIGWFLHGVEKGFIREGIDYTTRRPGRNIEIKLGSLFILMPKIEYDRALARARELDPRYQQTDGRIRDNPPRTAP